MESASKCHIVTYLQVPLGTDFSKLSESPWLGIESETPIPCFSYLRQMRGQANHALGIHWLHTRLGVCLVRWYTWGVLDCVYPSTWIWLNSAAFNQKLPSSSIWNKINVLYHSLCNSGLEVGVCRKLFKINTPACLHPHGAMWVLELLPFHWWPLGRLSGSTILGSYLIGQCWITWPHLVQGSLVVCVKMPGLVCGGRSGHETTAGSPTPLSLRWAVVVFSVTRRLEFSSGQLSFQGVSRAQESCFCPSVLRWPLVLLQAAEAFLGVKKIHEVCWALDMYNSSRPCDVLVPLRK